MDYLRALLLFLIAACFIIKPINAQDKALMNGTIIITLISQDTIWLGADSRTSSLTEKGYTVNKNGMCKINNTNNIVYAMAGHVRYVDNSFDFLEMMRNCINEQKDFDKSTILFQQRAKVEIRSILKKFSKKSINTLIKTNDGGFLSVVAISFENGEKKMKEMWFTIEADNNNNWKVIYNEKQDNGVGSLRFIGHASSASKYVKENNLFFGNGRSIPEKINQLIDIESKNSITVGLPADVISIYDGGFKKVITSGLCDLR